MTAENRELGSCARHPEEPGFALCSRCGDSACRACALSAEDAQCRACEEFKLVALAGRRRRSLPRAACAWVMLWLLVFVALPQGITFTSAGDPAPAGLGLAVLLSLMTLHDLRLARSQIEPWLADVRSRLEQLHARAEAGEEVGGEERRGLWREAARRAPRLLGAEKYPSKRSWERGFRQGLGLLLVAAFKLSAWLVLGEEGLFAKGAVALCAPAGLILAYRAWRRRPAAREARS